MPKAGDVGKGVAVEIPREWRELIDQVKHVYGHLGAGQTLTQPAVVDRLKDHGYPIHVTKLSKVLTGSHFPDDRLVMALYDLACDDAGAEAVGVTSEELRNLYRRAEGARCRSCAGHVRRIRELEKQAKSCRESHVDLRFPLSASAPSVQLPVPVPEGDRQRSELAAAVDELTEKAAGAVAEGRQEDALALIGEIPARMDAWGVAICVMAFRKRDEHSLAETLLRVYGREQTERQVMKLALRLQEAGFIAEAGVAMRASIG